MNKYNQIFENAIDNYGLITSAQLSQLNVSRTQIQRYVHDGRLERIGRGLYRISYYSPEGKDIYAQAVLLVDEDACLYGTSVLAMLEFGLLNPSKIIVATDKRIRKQLPDWIMVKKIKDINSTIIEGIRCQKLYDALLVAKNKMMPNRFAESVKQSQKMGYISKKEMKVLLED